MEVDDWVWHSGFQKPKRVKIIALNGDEACVFSSENGMFTCSIDAELWHTKKQALASMLKSRVGQLANDTKRLNELAELVRKRLADCIESLNAADE